MAKAEKHTLKLEIEKPQYITVNDVTYAQVWTLQKRPETGYYLSGGTGWQNLSMYSLDLRRGLADDG